MRSNNIVETLRAEIKAERDKHGAPSESWYVDDVIEHVTVDLLRELDAGITPEENRQTGLELNATAITCVLTKHGVNINTAYSFLKELRLAA